MLLDLAFRAVPNEKIPRFSELMDTEIDGRRFCRADEADGSNDDGFMFEIPRETSDSFEPVRKVVSRVVSFFLQLARDGVETAPGHREPFPLMGVGFGVTGPVDYDNAIWCATRFKDIKNISLQDLIGYENRTLADRLGLFFSIDNNSKSAMVSEYQYLFEESQGTYENDIFLLYIGSGVGSAAVVGHKLLRGGHNASGELGKIKLSLSGDEKNADSGKTIESYLAPEEPEQKPPKERYKECIPQILNMANCILGVDRFVLVGHNLRQYKELIPELMDQRIKFTVESTQQYCTAEPGRGKPSTSAAGAAIEAYFCMCNYNLNAAGNRRINLAKNISWHTPR